MRKFFLLVIGLSSGLLAASNSEIDGTLKAMGESGGMVGGGIGLFVPHLVFWLPILLFFVGCGGVIFFYYKQFQQKEDGVAKVILAALVGIFAGVLLYSVSLRAVDGAFDSDGCGKSVAVAYLKDSVQKGLNPTGYVFGTKIKEVGCLSN